MGRALQNCRYRKVFVFEILPFEKDYARTETEEVEREIGESLYVEYSKLGMEVIRVPVMSVADRVKYVLDRL